MRSAILSIAENRPPHTAPPSLPSCMLNSAPLNADEESAAGLINPAAGAGGSSMPSGSVRPQPRSDKTVGEPDRRRSCVVNPNSRMNRASTRRPSSHLQDWDPRMLDAVHTWVGIDLAKKSFDVAGIAGTAVQKIPNTTDGHQQLITLLPAPGTCLIVVESTGGYEQALVIALAMAEHLVAVVNPKQIRYYAKSRNVLAKTDRIDARIIADFARERRPLPKAYDADQEHLQALIVRRRQLVDHRTAERNRRQQTQFADIAKSVQQSIDAATKEIRRLDRQILERVKSDDDWRERFERAQTTPGIGPQVAAGLVAELPELGQISREKIASLAGLAPMNRDSGAFRGQRRIQGGRSGVRRLLYMAVMSGLKHNPVIRRYYARLKRKGKSSQLAMTACMRKLLVILNTMFKTRTNWGEHVASLPS